MLQNTCVPSESKTHIKPKSLKKNQWEISLD